MLSPANTPSPPAHGYRGEPEPETIGRPLGTTLAISREAGARGGEIARKVGELLGWQVFDQETLDFLIQNDTARDQLLSDLPRAARVWLDVEYTRLLTEREGSLDADTAVMVRLLFALAARGNCVLVGRGAGYLLPHESILHVRLIAPFEARTAYFAQILRLNLEEAANEVRAQDERRNRFLTRTLGVNPADWYGYDLIVNSERLGVESASQFIGWAVRTKQQFLEIQESEEHLRLADHPGLR